MPSRPSPPSTGNRDLMGPDLPEHLGALLDVARQYQELEIAGPGHPIEVGAHLGTPLQEGVHLGHLAAEAAEFVAECPTDAAAVVVVHIEHRPAVRWRPFRTKRARAPPYCRSLGQTRNVQSPALVTSGRSGRGRDLQDGVRAVVVDRRRGEGGAGVDVADDRHHAGIHQGGRHLDGAVVLPEVIQDHQLQRPAPDAACRVDLLDGHLGHVERRRNGGIVERAATPSDTNGLFIRPTAKRDRRRGWRGSRTERGRLHGAVTGTTWPSRTTPTKTRWSDRSPLLSNAMARVRPWNGGAPRSGAGQLVPDGPAVGAPRSR